MRDSSRLILGIFALCVAGGTALAQGSRDARSNPGSNPGTNPIPAIRADRWAEAGAAAASYADPVPLKLVQYYRLLAPGTASATEIADFMRTNPDWPSQAQLARRRQDALASEPDNTIVLAQCAEAGVVQAAALLRCADARAAAGQAAEAGETARRAWVSAIGDTGTEAAFQRRWAGLPTPDDEWARFQRLAWRDQAAASRQLPRLDPARRQAGDVRMALKRDDPVVDAQYLNLPPRLRDDPGMMLDRARNLRRTGRSAEAVALWTRAGAAAQRAEPEHLSDFWSERHQLVRKILREGDRAGAYAVAAEHGQTAAETLTDAEFLAGFIALRQLNDPGRATRHFRTLSDVSKAAITQGRAHYWLGRAAAASGRDPTEDYRRSAVWANTFYGQMAGLALGEDTTALSNRVRAMRDPEWTHDVATAFTGHEVVRAAAWLVAWGDPVRARPFLLRMDEIAPVAAERSLNANLALRVGLPDMAVFIARRVGRDGSALPQAGWPVPYQPPADFDASIALGIMRQESSFDIGAVSSSGARGLMQLMPFTARDVAKQLGIPTSLPVLTSDPDHNMRLGTTYIRDMLSRFGGSLPMAVAAYNAGPHRVDQWLGDIGDPRPSAARLDMIDWIELIPFNETRNYVQRVLENIVIYRARRNEDTPTLLTQWVR
jgi:soluble lytic murein transglycosylase